MALNLLKMAGGAAVVIGALQLALNKTPTESEVAAAVDRVETKVREAADKNGGLTPQQEELIKKLREATSVKQAQIDEYKRQAEERLKQYQADQKKLEADAARLAAKAEKLLADKKAKETAAKLAAQLKKKKSSFQAVSANDVPAEWSRREPASIPNVNEATFAIGRSVQ